jgi:two-component system, sensor histidine kinase and response regulator
MNDTGEQGPRGLRVLVAEDSPTQAAILRDALASAEYQVEVVGNGLQALAAARRSKPALIITDVVMPDMDGYELCRAVKSDVSLREVPVMILTSLREIDDIVMALECGADNFIRKPFERKALLARLDYLLVNRTLRSQSRANGGIEISLGGKKHLITAEREQMLDLLFSSYDEALQANDELRQRQEEVHSLNLQLASHAVELEDANRQLRSFCHTVSHDLRSPLGSIKTFSTVLDHQFGTSMAENARRYVAGIRQEAERTIRIVEDVLYLANIDRATVERRRIDLAGIAATIMETLRGGQPDRRVEFECPDRAWADCDERLLRIAMTNLLGNAWKFTGKQSVARIAFEIELRDDGPVFCIRDNGAGFDMAQAHRLFKPFGRLHRSDEFDGFGVGLATVHSIVALHGGRIWADAAPGRGAAFLFSLSKPASASGAATT